MSVIEVKDSRRAVDKVRAKYLADTGIENAMHLAAQAIKNAGPHDPLHGLTSLFGGGTSFTPFVGQPVMNGTRRVGAYTVTVSSVAQTSTSVTIAIDSTGYLPDAPTALPAGKRPDSWKAIRSTVTYSLAPSKVFDYAYFINNWGWFYGDTIHCNGNVRSNGQFDAANYRPTITGQPIYDSVSWNGVVAQLTGYQDDNHDGLQDGNDGGVWSGWNIVGSSHLQGNGGHAANQHQFQPPVSMPNLSDLNTYESNAMDQGGQITIDGVPMTNAVYGDEPGEHQNLYLNGTPSHPIVLHGPVVVRGDVIITGTVTGQGAIYSGGNVYVPDSINYLHPPTTTRPASTTQASTEAWLTANWNADFLGLFSRKNIVIGDCTNPTWQFYEAMWMGDALNQSKEDAGADGIPNTRAGRDGIFGTSDDDVLENDGVFTIQHYTASDAALGLIPAGHSIGDPIPGTGEDIDGNGVYDGNTTLADVVLATPLNSGHWGGNIGHGITHYSDIASMHANNLDAVFYTNHSFCQTVLGSQSANINGALVSRNENIIYGTPTININYDCRLLGGSSGMAGHLLPITAQPAQVVRWVELDHDPNLYVVHP